MAAQPVIVADEPDDTEVPPQITADATPPLGPQFAPLPKDRVSRFTPPKPPGPTLAEGDGPLSGLTQAVAANPYTSGLEKVGQTAIAHAAEGAVSPESLKYLAPAAVAGPLAPLVSAAFAGQMGKSFIEQNVPEIAEAYVNRDRDPQALETAAGKGVSTLGMAGMAGAHAVTGGAGAVARMAEPAARLDFGGITADDVAQPPPDIDALRRNIAESNLEHFKNELPEPPQPVAPPDQPGFNRFHGSKNAIQNLTPDGHFSGSPRNIYGAGLYTTNDPGIANSYAKGGKTLGVEQNAPVKFYGLDRPPDALFIDWAKGGEDAWSNPITDTILDEIERDPSQPMSKILAEARVGNNVNDYAELMDGLQHTLGQEGFGGFTHRGGILTKGQPHDVRVYFDPANQVSVGDATKPVVSMPQRFDADPQAIIDYNKWEAENAPPGGYREISEVARPTDASELEIQQAARELNALDEAAAESSGAPAAGPGPAEAIGADRPAPGNGPAESTSLRAANPAARGTEPLEAGAPEEGNPRDVRGQVEGDITADEAPEARSLGAGAPGDLDRSQVLSRAIAEKPSMASQALREIQEQLSPVQVDEASRIFGGHMKEQNAIQALEKQRFTKEAADGILKLDRLSPQEQNDFFDKAEQGLPQATPELDQVAAVMRRYQDAQTKGLVEGGHLEDVIQNYMPHQYENEALGLKLFNQRQSSIPNWQKERTYPLRSEAQAAGLTPKYPNPVEDVLTSYGRKGDYLATATAIKKGIDDGVIQVYDKNTSPAPGTDLVELDPKFVKMAGDAVGEGQTLAAPRSIATLLERNASVGLNKYAAYRGARAVAGGLNTAQLLGPFHAATSAFNSFYSRMGLGVTEALRSVFEPNLQGGRLAEATEGAKDIALSPLAPILEGINGYKARKAALEHSGLSPVDQELVAGGHRIDMSEDYTTGAYMAFRRAVAQSKNAKAAALFPGAVLDRVMYPIMQVLVPSLKTGHYLEAAAAELKRLGPEASEAQKRQSLGRVADAVDDRFGQLVYDNGFWNKTFRNAMQLAMRSPGWVAGSLRAGLGGAKDIVRVPSRFAEQRNNPSAVQDPVITQRMGYLVAQAVGPMLVGSLYGYLKGGNENKQKYLDYVAPKTGGKNKSGTPERYVPAGYTKEFYAWHHDPFATAISKRNPMLSLAQDLSAGKDFIGTPFRNPNDPALTRMKDSATYALEQMAPIFSRGTLLPDPNINPRSNIGLGERMVGAPAPAYMASEEKMNKATESRFLKAKRKRTSQ